MNFDLISFILGMLTSLFFAILLFVILKFFIPETICY